ncbi:MAG: DUF2867 domain-containing protein [Burkholderiaceae bacterium]|nr:DUF2867 domain-containing protein [Burkholderiaceae bacterium]
MMFAGKRVRETGVPQDSCLSPELASAYFYDAYEVRQGQGGRSGESALQVALRLAGTAPPWFDFLMTTRNRIVGWFGLKNLGRLSAVDRNKAPGDYRIGDRIGIFTLLSVTPEEVILGDDDKHLRAQISVFKRRNVTISTVVHVHNFLGRAYLFFVIPAHRLIVPPLLKRLATV